VLGMTLNMIVLFSLVLALGMLVDNGIVLVENIYRHMEEGADLRTASIVGAKEVAGAVAASTATTVAAFAEQLCTLVRIGGRSVFHGANARCSSPVHRSLSPCFV
jgi:Cu/Ag efflux pump CusA